MDIAVLETKMNTLTEQQQSSVESYIEFLISQNYNQTVGGLIVGIIAYFGYNWLTSRISDLVYKMESSTLEFIDIVLNPTEEA